MTKRRILISFWRILSEYTSRIIRVESLLQKRLKLNIIIRRIVSSLDRIYKIISICGIISLTVSSSRTELLYKGPFSQLTLSLSRMYKSRSLSLELSLLIYNKGITNKLSIILIELLTWPSNFYRMISMSV